MNICWYNHRCIKHPEAGGSEEHLHQIAKRLTSLGFNIDVFCEKTDSLSSAETIDGVHYNRRGGRSMAHLYALWHTATSHYDLYIDDNAHAVPWLSPLFKKNTLAIAHHLHRDILIDETGPVLGRLLQLFESLTPIIYKDTPFIAVSESTQRELVEFGVPEKNITVVKNGIDSNPLKVNKTSFPQLIYFGRYRKYKRIELILYAFQKIKAQLPNARLTIAGRGVKNTLLTNLIEELDLTPYVEILDGVPRESKDKLLAESWVNLLASVKEGWSITVIEAAMQKTPTVAFDVPGVRDSVIDGETGKLVAVEDVESFVEAIIELILNDELRHGMGEKAQQRARELTWDKTCEGFLNVIKRCVGN